jgi:hypothetical protein
LVDDIDDAAHIEQVSVVPAHQGRGVGWALINRAWDWATENSRSALTLLTFDQISWNRPLYEHLGSRVLSDEEMGPGLKGIRDTEAAHGLDPTTRVAMRLELGRSARGHVAGVIRDTMDPLCRCDVRDAPLVFEAMVCQTDIPWIDRRIWTQPESLFVVGWRKQKLNISEHDLRTTLPASSESRRSSKLIVPGSHRARSATS